MRLISMCKTVIEIPHNIPQQLGVLMVFPVCTAIRGEHFVIMRITMSYPVPGSDPKLQTCMIVKLVIAPPT